MKSIGEKIADGIQKFYTAFINQRVLTTPEEVQANTNEKNLASAVVVGEIYNNLMQQPEWIKDSTGKITGYKTPGGADTVFPFSAKLTSYGGSYTGNQTIPISDDLLDKNFILIVTGVYCSGVADNHTVKRNKSFTIHPQISKSGNTLSISGCAGSAMDIAFTIAVSVTYSIYYY